MCNFHKIPYRYINNSPEPTDEKKNGRNLIKIKLGIYFSFYFASKRFRRILNERRKEKSEFSFVIQLFGRLARKKKSTQRTLMTNSRTALAVKSVGILIWQMTAASPVVPLGNFKLCSQAKHPHTVRD